MNLDRIIKKVIKEEVEQSELKSKLQDLVDKLGVERASKAVGGTKNLIKILYDGDLKKYYKENDIEPYIITNQPNLHIDDLLVQSLELPNFRFSDKGEKTLGVFILKNQGKDFKFTVELQPMTDYSGKKTWRAVASSSDYGLGYKYNPEIQKLNKRTRIQIFKQIIDKYNLDSYK